MKIVNSRNLLLYVIVMCSSFLFSQSDDRLIDNKNNPKSWKIQTTQEEANDMLYGHLFDVDLDQRLLNISINDWSTLVSEVTLLNDVLHKYTLSTEDKLKFESYLVKTILKASEAINQALLTNTCHPSEIGLLQKYSQEIK